MQTSVRTHTEFRHPSVLLPVHLKLKLVGQCDPQRFSRAAIGWCPCNFQILSHWDLLKCQVNKWVIGTQCPWHYKGKCSRGITSHHGSQALHHTL